MIVIEHYDIRVEIPPARFGNDRDIYIRDAMEQLHKALKNTGKVPEEKKKENVITVMKLLKHLSKQ